MALQKRLLNFILYDSDYILVSNQIMFGFETSKIGKIVTLFCSEQFDDNQETKY